MAAIRKIILTAPHAVAASGDETGHPMDAVALDTAKRINEILRERDVQTLLIVPTEGRGELDENRPEARGSEFRKKILQNVDDNTLLADIHSYPDGHGDFSDSDVEVFKFDVNQDLSDYVRDELSKFGWAAYLVDNKSRTGHSDIVNEMHENNNPALLIEISEKNETEEIANAIAAVLANLIMIDNPIKDKVTMKMKMAEGYYKDKSRYKPYHELTRNRKRIEKMYNGLLGGKPVQVEEKKSSKEMLLKINKLESEMDNLYFKENLKPKDKSKISIIQNKLVKLYESMNLKEKIVDQGVSKIEKDYPQAYGPKNVESMDFNTKDLKVLESVPELPEEDQKEFDKEQKEHPEFPPNVIWQIVKDHKKKEAAGAGDDVVANCPCGNKGIVHFGEDDYKKDWTCPKCHQTQEVEAPDQEYSENRKRIGKLYGETFKEAEKQFQVKLKVDGEWEDAYGLFYPDAIDAFAAEMKKPKEKRKYTYGIEFSNVDEMQVIAKESYKEAEMLPIYQIKGKGFYFRDERLGEYRNVKDPMDSIPIDDVPNEQLTKAKPGDFEKAIQQFGKAGREDVSPNDMYGNKDIGAGAVIPQYKEGYIEYSDPFFLRQMLIYLPHYGVNFHADASAGRIYIDHKDESKVRQIFQKMNWATPVFVESAKMKEYNLDGWKKRMDAIYYNLQPAKNINPSDAPDTPGAGKSVVRGEGFDVSSPSTSAEERNDFATLDAAKKARYVAARNRGIPHGAAMNMVDPSRMWKEKVYLKEISEKWFREATNDEVVDAFLHGSTAKSSSAMTDGNKLWSYNTVIADRKGNQIRLSNAKYSSTTSQAQGRVKRMAAQMADAHVTEVPPEDLGETGERKESFRERIDKLNEQVMVRKFRNKKTGKIVTQVPLLDIANYEPVDEEGELEKESSKEAKLIPINLHRDEGEEEPKSPVGPWLWFEDEDRDSIASVVGEKGDVQLRMGFPQKGTQGKDHMDVGMVGADPTQVVNHIEDYKRTIKRYFGENGFEVTFEG